MAPESLFEKLPFFFVQNLRLFQNLNNGITAFHGNATEILATWQTEIALLTPGLVPTVLDNPIVLAIFTAIAHNQNGMIYLTLVAFLIGIDATFVEQQRFQAIDRTGQGAQSCNDLFHCGLIIFIDFGKPSNFGSLQIRLITAGILLVQIWIDFIFGHTLLIGNKFKGILLEATITASQTHVLFAAINEILFGEINQLAGLAEIVALNGPRGGK